MAGIGMAGAGPDARASPFASPANPPNRHRASASANAHLLQPTRALFSTKHVVLVLYHRL